MGHRIAWVEEEMVGISRCDNILIPTDDQFSVDIYEFRECPVCHKKLKLRQVNELIEEETTSE